LEDIYIIHVCFDGREPPWGSFKHLDTPFKKVEYTEKVFFFAYWPSVLGLLRSLRLRGKKQKNMSKQEQKLFDMFFYLL
jgi:hypothetical protein